MNERARSADFRGHGARLYVSRYVVVRFVALALSALLGVGEVLAAIPEICGNGIDDVWQTGGAANGTIGSCPANFADAIVGSGCDHLCTNTVRDQDHDGYTDNGSTGAAGTAYTDCDDTRRDVYPGQYVPNSWASPTGYKLCQTNGTYGSTVLNATTPLCEATGSGVCYYIQSTGGGTTCSYASPCSDLSYVSGGAGGTPVGAKTLAPGDVVYVLGTGTITTIFTATNGAGDGAFSSSVDGTSANKITIKNYPGATAEIQPTAGQVLDINGDYYIVDGIRGKGVSNGIRGRDADNVEIRNTYIHDPTGLHGDASQASCILVTGAGFGNNINVHHTFNKNCLRTFGNEQNVSAIGFVLNAGAGSGDGNITNFNVIWLDTKSDTLNGNCIREKHGTLSSDVGAAGHEVKYNYCINYDAFVEWNGSGLRALYNFVYGASVGGPRCDSEPGSYPQDNEMQYNTFVSSESGPSFNPCYGTGWETLETFDFSHNVFQDTHTSFTGDCRDATVHIDGFMTDANFATFTSASGDSTINLVSDYNCYESTGVTARLGIACDTQAGVHPAGNNYTFANWQSAGSGPISGGLDANGFLSANLNFTAYNYVPQDSDCTAQGFTVGYLYSESGGGGGGSSSGYVCGGG